MTKKITTITLAILMVIGGPVLYSYADRNDLREIEEKRQNIQENLSKAEKQINSILSEMEELNREIEEVNQEIQENESIIEETDKTIANTVEDIQILQEEVKKLEEDIEYRYHILEDRIVSYQKTGGNMGFLEVILGSESFTDMIGRILSINKIAQSDVTLMEQLELDKEELEEKQQLAFEKLDELNEMKSKQEETLEMINEQKEKLVEDSNLLDKKQQELDTFIKELEEEDSELAAVEAKVRQEIEIARKKAEEAKKREAERKAREEANRGSDNLETVGKETLTMTSTAYTAYCTGCTGVTTTGIDLRANPDAKVIAVDPTVIPLGSIVHVEGYGYAIAGDTGGAIKGNKIDVFVSSKSRALQWGIRKVKVTIQ